MDKPISKPKQWKTCSVCGVRLWKWIDENRISILGHNGQDFQICFNSINLTCKKCGAEVCITSSVSNTIEELFFDISGTTPRMQKIAFDQNPYYGLSSAEKKKIIPVLDEEQKILFHILTEELGNAGRNTAELSKRLDKPVEEIKAEILELYRTIKTIKPLFGIKSIDASFDKTSLELRLEK